MIYQAWGVLDGKTSDVGTLAQAIPAVCWVIRRLRRSSGVAAV